ncbi:MAG: response regulator [Thermodesulfobacteriota bacterium]|nr:response regulator [Thermodesulfobacteriota bacterium]
MMARILIVDDQACIRAFLSEELIAEGYRVQTAHDAESVRGYLRFWPPDLILLDFCLDGHDGVSVLHEIKDQYPGLPVIIFTAYDSYREDPRISEADGYVIKSMFLGKLKRKIAYLLGPERNSNMVPKAQPFVQGVAGDHGL